MHDIPIKISVIQNMLEQKTHSYSPFYLYYALPAYLHMKQVSTV